MNDECKCFYFLFGEIFHFVRWYAGFYFVLVSAKTKKVAYPTHVNIEGETSTPTSRWQEFSFMIRIFFPLALRLVFSHIIEYKGY